MSSLRFVFEYRVNELIRKDLAFADGDHVGEIGDRFGIQKRRRAAHDDERIEMRAVLRPDGHARKLQHPRHVQIVGLEGYRECDDIKITNAASASRATSAACPVRSYSRDLVRVGQEDTLAGDPRNGVEKLVHRVKPEIRHPDRVGVRIAQRDAQVCAACRTV